MKKYFTLILIICLTLSLTACSKKGIRTLTCEYDLSSDAQGFDKTNLTVTFDQDIHNYKIIDGRVTFTVKSSSMTTAQANEIKKSFEEEFCSEGFFGEGTNKSCKVTIDSQSITATIEVDSEKFLETIDADELNENTLDELKEVIEEEFGTETIKCTIK